MEIGYTTQGTTSKYMSKFIELFSRINVSLRSKILFSFIVVIVLMVSINTMMILEVLRFNRHYDSIITNITTRQQYQRLYQTCHRYRDVEYCGRQN